MSVTEQGCIAFLEKYILTSDSVKAWMKQHNPSTEELNKCIHGTCEAATSLTLLTMNVWFDDDEVVGRDARTTSLVQYIISQLPQIIHLQEVTSPVYTTLANSLSDMYHVSPIPPSLTKLYFCTTLVRKDLAFESFTCSTFPNTVMGRYVLFTRFKFRGERFVTLNTHLESMQSYKSARLEQLSMILDICDAISPSIHVLIAGDLNLAETEGQEIVSARANLVDVWRTLHPTLPGYTMDNLTNDFVKKWPTRGVYQRRLDRVYIRSQRCHATLIDIVERDENGVPFSDHYGLYTRIKVR